MSMDQRKINRDSLFLLAGLRVAGRPNEYRVRVRNISDGGLMAEGDARLVVGVAVEIEVRNVGWVNGSVAWVEGNRCGIAFDEPIDPVVARAAMANKGEEEFYVRRPLAHAAMRLNSGRLRKV